MHNNSDEIILCICASLWPKFSHLYLHSDESRMLSLSIAAAVTHLSRPPAMLIIRLRTSASEAFGQNHNRKKKLGGLEGGQVESAEACGASGASADSGGREDK